MREISKKNYLVLLGRYGKKLERNPLFKLLLKLSCLIKNNKMHICKEMIFKNRVFLNKKIERIQNQYDIKVSRFLDLSKRIPAYYRDIEIKFFVDIFMFYLLDCSLAELKLQKDKNNMYPLHKYLVLTNTLRNIMIFKEQKEYTISLSKAAPNPPVNGGVTPKEEIINKINNFELYIKDQLYSEMLNNNFLPYY